MQIGDVVIPAEGGSPLSGSVRYTHAICVSVEPFILISEKADMRWSCRESDSVVALCQVHPDILARCMDRLNRDREAGKV